MTPFLNIAVITIKELLHEKVLYLLGAFAVLALLISLLLGELTYAEQSKLTLDFLLAGTQITNLLFSVFMGISLLHRELNLGWIAMVLSKPVSRTQFLLGKFLGQITIQGLVILLMGGLTIGLGRMFQIELVYQSLFQTLLLTFFEGIIMSTIVYLFAVNLGALLSAAASLLVFALGNFSEGAIKTSSTGQTSTVWQVIQFLTPNLRILNMKTLASYGLTLEWRLVGILTLYTIVCSAMYFVLASLSFSKRDIFT
jgi:ABC-type transport system involved in multi-copper enzyme maturation permease subunit